MKETEQKTFVGIDVGSTTVKATAIRADSHETLASTYRRHHAHQLQTAIDILAEIREAVGDAPVQLAVTGSGGKELANALSAPYVQEVIANSIAVAADYPQARVAIELGGQDAKMIFFEPGETPDTLKVSDMRMNGSCAGGTGAFLDEIASLLKIPVEQLDAAAAAGTTLYSISGRCGVFAKTDIQPLINQGAAREDIALSTFHAVAKQTLGGLAQGLDVIPPVIFEGGPLTFNPTLVRVFAERLGINGGDAIVPDNPEIIVARGAALSLAQEADDEQDASSAHRETTTLSEAPAVVSATPPAPSATSTVSGDHTDPGASTGPAQPRRGGKTAFTTLAQAQETIRAFAATNRKQASSGKPFFSSAEELAAFRERHALAPEPAGPAAFERGQVVHAYLGIDSGSTTTKFAVINEEGELIDSFYANNEGDPLDVAQAALAQLDDRWRAAGVALDIRGCATTGYGELLFAKAFRADCHVVETVAHALAAARFVGDATFILDIGGQDMKAIWIDDGIVTDILVNEACSSGCGSFLENFAHSLGFATHEIADAAFRSQSPAELGSRCTVFMTSSVVTEQKNGKSPDDIMAGLCRSIIENVFTKVIRVPNLNALGERIVVQGGTFANDAVLAAFEDYVGRPVTRAPYPGLMGAIGAALFARRNAGAPDERLARDAQQVNTSPAQEWNNGYQNYENRTSNDSAENNRPEVPSGHLLSQFDEERSAADARDDAKKRYWHGNDTVRGQEASTFIGLAGVRNLTYAQTANVTCPFCSNNCARSVITFSDGTTYVTGNRCERGEVVGNPRDAAVAAQVKAIRERKNATPNLYEVRERLLFNDYPAPALAPRRGITIGIPRVLSFWDTMPFWTTFWRSLGFDVRLSRPSSRALFESGLHAVTSDTVCFPAKLVHGHIRDLERARVDRIFMPSITAVPSENTEKTSESMCAVVKGYAIVMRNSDNPEQRANVTFDAPLFHWHSDADRLHQLSGWMSSTFGIEPGLTEQAVKAGDAAMSAFRAELTSAGRHVMEQVRRNGTYAVVLASRPYHNDPLVNHDLPAMFTALGIPVITPDAIEGLGAVDLSRSRLDIVNNYHARMLASAIIAAEDPNLEYAQVVSFGCGHDAYLSDEIVRLTHAITDKSPLILKVDESDVPGPLRIRIRSFVQTINMKRQERATAPLRKLTDPYPVKYRKADRREKVILVPNTSHAFGRLMAAAFSKQGARAVPVPIGRDEAIRLGKQYVHNDICFPAQITIGECLAELKSGKYDDTQVAIGTGKYIGDCRLTHYGALLRKALDDAGFAHVPIITNDDVDYHDLHPGFRLTVATAARIAMVLPMIDALEELLRKMRPYELVPGTAEAAFELALDEVMNGLERHGARGAQAGFERAIAFMNAVDYDRSNPRPRVLIVGEYLLNFHPGANHDVEAYLEANGFEVVEARMTDVIRKSYFYQGAQIAEYDVKKPFTEATWYRTANALFEHAHEVCDRIASAHPLYEPPCRMPELVQASDPIIHHTFDAGEGVLIPAEIIHHAERGCEAFLILQPFGCLPNHIVGRGIVKRLRELYPSAQILSLDYDPDVSFANVENRLQMLVMNVRKSQQARIGAQADGCDTSIEKVTESVATVAEGMDELVDEVLQTSATFDGSAYTPEHISATGKAMRAVLEQEDRLAAQAKDALAAARKVASHSADDAAKTAVASALAAYELAREMRTRTSTALATVTEIANSLAESGEATLAAAQSELATRIADGRVFAARAQERARALMRR